RSAGLLVLPALSVAVPLTLWFAPSPRVFGAGQVLIPDPLALSAQVNATVTSLLYQPLLFAVRSVAAPMVGLVVSILIGPKLALALLPALSAIVPATFDVTPSALKV